jgi:hypothetical protein
MSRRCPAASLIGPLQKMTVDLKEANTAARADGTCSICYREFKIGEEVAYSEACCRTRLEDFWTTCHIYHKECMLNWIRSHKNKWGNGRPVPCPHCRKTISDDDVVAFGGVAPPVGLLPWLND